MRDAIDPGDGLDWSNPSDHEKVADGLDCPNPSPTETVRLGQAALARLARGWADWMPVAAALEVGRTEAMRAVHTNEPQGRRYEAEMARWLNANNFQQIDKGDRSPLLQCLEHREEVERWRTGLTESQRAKLNHPSAVWRKWRKSLAPVADPEPKASPVAKLMENVARLEQENHRLRREVEDGGGDLWSPKDTNRDIAKVMVAKLGPNRWRKVVQEAARLMEAAKGVEASTAEGAP